MSKLCFFEDAVEMLEDDVRQLAITSILRFFEDKEYLSGGKIPERELLKEQNINIVSNTTVLDGIDEIYEILELNDPPEGYEKYRKEWQRRLLQDLFAEAGRKGIPKSFVAGISIICLDYCYGINKWTIWS